MSSETNEAELAAYHEWRISAQALQAARAAMAQAEQRHREAFVRLGNLVAPEVK